MRFPFKGSALFVAHRGAGQINAKKINMKQQPAQVSCELRSGAAFSHLINYISCSIPTALFSSRSFCVIHGVSICSLIHRYMHTHRGSAHTFYTHITAQETRAARHHLSQSLALGISIADCEPNSLAPHIVTRRQWRGKKRCQPRRLFLKHDFA